VILIDSNVVLDLITSDPVWADWSQQQLNTAARTGELAINDVVYAEVSVRYTQMAELDIFLERIGIGLLAIPRSALFLAGKVFARYRAAGGLRAGVLPDFFIGAQATVMNAPLITRDVRRYRAYFPGIELIAPDFH
jgi:predicted nucleic acid-binding protein